MGASQQEIDLASEDLEVLHLIQQSKQPTSTVTLKEQLHWADDGGKVRYRLEKLEGRGLVETWLSEERSDAHKMPVRVAELTDAGANIADEYEDDPEALPLERRVRRLEKRLNRMQETYGKAKQRIVELENEVEEHDEDLDDLAEEIDNVQLFLDFSGTSSGDDS